MEWQTRKLPRVVAIEIEEGYELDVEAFALNLAPEVELDKLLLSRVEAKAGHDKVVLVIILAVVCTHGCYNCHKLVSYGIITPFTLSPTL